MEESKKYAELLSLFVLVQCLKEYLVVRKVSFSIKIDPLNSDVTFGCFLNQQLMFLPFLNFVPQSIIIHTDNIFNGTERNRNIPHCIQISAS